MSSELSRFGVAMDRLLLKQFDEVVRERGSTRSAVLSDLARAEVVRTLIEKPILAVGTLTLVYDHHVRDLSEKLTEMQHELGEKVHSTMHIHLEQDRCLEVIVLRGRADILRNAADRLIATRGILHGTLELFADQREEQPQPHAAHSHGHAHAHAHPHTHAIPRPRALPEKSSARTTRKPKSRKRAP